MCTVYHLTLDARMFFFAAGAGAGDDGGAEGDAPGGACGNGAVESDDAAGGSGAAEGDDAAGGSGDAEVYGDFFVRSLDSEGIAMRRDLAKFPGEFKTRDEWCAWRAKRASAPLHKPESAAATQVYLYIHLSACAAAIVGVS